MFQFAMQCMQNHNRRRWTSWRAYHNFIKWLHYLYDSRSIIMLHTKKNQFGVFVQFLKHNGVNVRDHLRFSFTWTISISTIQLLLNCTQITSPTKIRKWCNIKFFFAQINELLGIGKITHYQIIKYSTNVLFI